jgi:exonuclease V gamma subunit
MLCLLPTVGGCTLLAIANALPGVAGELDYRIIRGGHSTGLWTETQSQEAPRQYALAALRAKAEERIRQDRSIYSEQEFREIELQYVSAHHFGNPVLPMREAQEVLRKLIENYPKSNRAGCAVLELAQLSAGTAREEYLKEAIAHYDDSWYENGVQVGALARARLAIHYAGFGRFDEAEKLAEELTSLFSGAVDHSGAPLDDVPQAIKLLRPLK